MKVSIILSCVWAAKNVNYIVQPDLRNIIDRVWADLGQWRQNAGLLY